MPQSFNTEGSTATGSGCQLQGPLQNALLDMLIHGGETFRWKVCYCGDQHSIQEINPAGTITLDQSSCTEAGDCIKVWCHEGNCDSKLANGEHVVNAVDATGEILTVATDLSALDVESFAALPPIPGCTTEAVTPPTMCVLKDISEYVFNGVITNRIPTTDTRLALAVDTTTGSNIVRPKESGDIQVGDTVSIPDVGISNATVLETYFEHGTDWLVLDQSANSTTCAGLTSRVGEIARFDIEQAAACGCATVKLSAATTRDLPLTGERVNPSSNSAECAPYYKLGIYSLYASYLNTDMEVETELVARGCVKLFPSNLL